MAPFLARGLRLELNDGKAVSWRECGGRAFGRARREEC